jgi:hypothetical protein
MNLAANEMQQSSIGQYFPEPLPDLEQRRRSEYITHVSLDMFAIGINSKYSISAALKNISAAPQKLVVMLSPPHTLVWRRFLGSQKAVHMKDKDKSAGAFRTFLEKQTSRGTDSYMVRLLSQCAYPCVLTANQLSQAKAVLRQVTVFAPEIQGRSGINPVWSEAVKLQEIEKQYLDVIKHEQEPEIKALLASATGYDMQLFEYASKMLCVQSALQFSKPLPIAQHNVSYIRGQHIMSLAPVEAERREPEFNCVASDIDVSLPNCNSASPGTSQLMRHIQELRSDLSKPLANLKCSPAPSAQPVAAPCELPRLTVKYVTSVLRNKKVVIIGDSTMRYFYQTLAAILESTDTSWPNLMTSPQLHDRLTKAPGSDGPWGYNSASQITNAPTVSLNKRGVELHLMKVHVPEFHNFYELLEKNGATADADVVLFGFGLHVLHMLPAPFKHLDKFPNVFRNYEAHLRESLDMLRRKMPNAQIIWRTPNVVCDAARTNQWYDVLQAYLAEDQETMKNCLRFASANTADEFCWGSLRAASGSRSLAMRARRVLQDYPHVDVLDSALFTDKDNCVDYTLPGDGIHFRKAHGAMLNSLLPLIHTAQKEVAPAV